MRVKAKFVCNSILLFQHGNKQVKLSAVYGKEGENADFAKATPYGELTMNIDLDVPAAEVFNPGDEFYVYFEKIDKN
ncbi:MAG TPA: hypothetical protein VK616_18335 [Flavitalea sp.]|nr:hypothetical protein [Flavitalea sp.]